MTVLQNFDVYFPVQLWVSVFQEKKKYRFVAPLLGFPHEYRFHPHFWDALSLSPSEKADMEKYWTLQATIWAFHPKYYLYLNRGFATVAINNENQHFPFSTFKISVFRNASTFYSSSKAFKDSFAFVVYSYPVPGTRLLYVHNNSDLDQSTLQIVLFENEGTSLSTEQEPNFLPRPANKNISCYDIQWDNYNFFFYVFLEKPSGQYFRLTSTALCVPSQEEKDHKSMLECIQKSVEQRVLPGNTFFGSPLTELQQVMYTYPASTSSSNHHGGVLSMTFVFLMSLLILWRVFFVSR